MINQIATYYKVNDCFISWKCLIVIYLQIHRHNNKISQLWSSRKTNVKHHLIGYWTTKKRIWYESKSPIFPHLVLYLSRVISLSGHLPGSIFSREGDIASTQNLLISFMPIICKLNYSHVITTIINSSKVISHEVGLICFYKIIIYRLTRLLTIHLRRPDKQKIIYDSLFYNISITQG